MELTRQRSDISKWKVLSAWHIPVFQDVEFFASCFICEHCFHLTCKSLKVCVLSQTSQLTLRHLLRVSISSQNDPSESSARYLERCWAQEFDYFNDLPPACNSFKLVNFSPCKLHKGGDRTPPSSKDLLPNWSKCCDQVGEDFLFVQYLKIKSICGLEIIRLRGLFTWKYRKKVRHLYFHTILITVPINQQICQSFNFWIAGPTLDFGPSLKYLIDEKNVSVITTLAVRAFGSNTYFKNAKHVTGVFEFSYGRVGQPFFFRDALFAFNFKPVSMFIASCISK